jgi:hypothetical protein
VIGASMRGSPMALSSSLRERVSKGHEEDISTTTVPGSRSTHFQAFPFYPFLSRVLVLKW